MQPRLELFFFDLPLYTALVALGCAMGLAATYLYLRARARRAATRELFFVDGALLVFAAGWVGARAYHVAWHWDYYAARPAEIAQFGLGGLGLRGALIAGMLALALLAWLHKIKFWKLADAVALGATLAQGIGWVGALTWGANYGVVSDLPIALELPDGYGLIEPRFPLQHAEIAMFAVLFVGLVVLAARPIEAGTIFFVAICASAWGNFALGFFRGDESVFIGALRADQIVDAGMGIFAAGGLAWKTRAAPSKEIRPHSKVKSD